MLEHVEEQALELRKLQNIIISDTPVQEEQKRNRHVQDQGCRANNKREQT
jgi:hypothetical protein